MKNRSIFSATFEESKKVVNKKITTLEGSGLYASASMEPENKAIFFIIGGLLFGFVMYLIGILLPEEFLTSGSNQGDLLSSDSAFLIGQVGKILKPFTIISMILYIGSLIVNFFPKKNYAYHLGYVNVINILFLIFLLFVVSPFTIGVTINGTGILGFFVQLVLGFGLLIKGILKNIEDYQEIFFGEKDGQEKMQRNINDISFVRNILGILLIFSIINRRFIHFGGDIGNSGIFGIAIGFFTIFIFYMYRIAIELLFPLLINTFYFIKYSDQYHELFNIPDEIWCGKTKAALMVRQREAKKVREAKEAAEKNSKET